VNTLSTNTERHYRSSAGAGPAGMGVLRSTQSLEAEVDELRAALLAGGWRRSAGHADAKRAPRGDAGGAAARAVCVTGGISFVGFAVVDRLLRHGYTVRLALETQGTSRPVRPPPHQPTRLLLSLALKLSRAPLGPARPGPGGRDGVYVKKKILVHLSPESDRSRLIGCESSTTSRPQARSPDQTKYG
jgi:hypothetical protein